ncbi:MAG TPA: CrcB family protein [Acidimicrobiales bacterium]|nr:CrcB family protein [Acidimicrobiales bacterium]
MSPFGDDHPGVPLDPDLGVDPPGGFGSRRRRRRMLRPQVVIVGALAVGGSIGAVSRYAISLALPTVTGRFPWGTFVINVSGSFVLGFLLITLIEQFPLGRLARPVIGTGIIGAYTTFSTFMTEAVLLVRAGDPALALAYLGASLVVGLVAVSAGMLGARVVLRAERWLQEEMT